MKNPAMIDDTEINVNLYSPDKMLEFGVSPDVICKIFPADCERIKKKAQTKKSKPVTTK